MTGPAFPTLQTVVLDATDARALAEFYRQLLGYVYRPGDEAPPAGEDDPKGCDYVVLVDPSGAPRLAFQQVAQLPALDVARHRDTAAGAPRSDRPATSSRWRRNTNGPCGSGLSSSSTAPRTRRNASTCTPTPRAIPSASSSRPNSAAGGARAGARPSSDRSGIMWARPEEDRHGNRSARCGVAGEGGTGHIGDDPRARSRAGRGGRRRAGLRRVPHRPALPRGGHQRRLPLPARARGGRRRRGRRARRHGPRAGRLRRPQLARRSAASADRAGGAGPGTASRPTTPRRR